MKILIAGKICENENLIREISSMGHTVTEFPDERVSLVSRGISPKDFEGVICNGLFLYNDAREFLNLKYVQLLSAGLDRVPVDYLNARGVKIFNAKGVYDIPISEFALCGVLDLYKRSAFFYENKKRRKFEKRRDLIELYGKTVLIVGCGSVGTECAKKFSAMGTKVLGVDIIKKTNPYFESIYTINELDSILPNADIVILTLPLTEKTEGLFDEYRFSLMKKGSVIVNVSRGKVVVESALISALKTRLYGGVIDVFEAEPLPSDSELWSIDNAVITPHNSFVSENNDERLNGVILKNLKDMK